MSREAIEYAIKVSKENAEFDYKRFVDEGKSEEEARRLADERLKRALNGVSYWFGESI